MTLFSITGSSMDVVLPTLHLLGLIVVVLYIICNIDEIIWDIATLFRRLGRHDRRAFDTSTLDEAVPRPMAILMPVWDEGPMLVESIANMVKTIHYPQSMYHIFVGVSPSDEKAIEASAQAAAQHVNVHVVVNPNPGPETRADNLNFIIKQMRAFEEVAQIAFAAMFIHDPDDIIHPYELKAANVLLNSHQILQFPVFPLQEMPRLGNYVRNLTLGTYADEFADKCYSTMINRRHTGAFVPAMGSGFVVSREVFAGYGHNDLFSPYDVSDGYQLSLALMQHDIHVHYALEQVPRIRDDGRMVGEYIATRTHFPADVRSAIRDRTRSIFGTTMQSLRLGQIFKIRTLKPSQRYSLYRDIKPRWNNFITPLAYLVLLYFLLSIVTPLPVLFPPLSLSFYACLLMLLLVLEKQVRLAVALSSIYGKRSAFIASFLPPIFSIRAVWGSVINLIATARAWGYSLALFMDRRRNLKTEHYRKALEWNRTQHEFINERVLQRFHRNLGDVLLEKGFVSPAQLQAALNLTRDTPQTIGNYLLEMGYITEEQLLTTLSHIKHVQYLEVTDPQVFVLPQIGHFFDRALLEELVVAPLLRTDTGFVVAFCDSSPYNAQSILRERYRITVNAVLATQSSIEATIRYIYNNIDTPVKHGFILRQYESGKINYEQTIIAYNYLQATGWDEEDVLKRMGLNPSNQRERPKQLEQVDVIFDELITHTIEMLKAR